MLRLARALGMTYAQAGRQISSRELIMWKIAERLDEFAAFKPQMATGEVPITIERLLGGKTVTLGRGEYRTRRKPIKKKVRPDERKESVGMKGAAMLGLKVYPHE